MRRALSVLAVLVVAGLALAATRPASEYSLMLQLNGQPTRWVMVDGGASGLYGSPPRCIPLANSGGASGLTAQVLKLTPNVPLDLCVRPALGNVTSNNYASGWDGGCNSIHGDLNKGDPLQPWVPHYVVLVADPLASYLCASGDGGTLATDVFRMQ